MVVGVDDANVVVAADYANVVVNVIGLELRFREERF